MEYIQGLTLSDLLLAKGKIQDSHLAFIVREICKGLAVMHAKVPLDARWPLLPSSVADC